VRMTSLLLVAFLLLGSQASALTLVTEEPLPSARKENPFTGIAASIVKEIQKRTGDVSETEVLPWARAYALATSHPGVVLFPTTRTPEREQLFTWVGPIMRIQWAFFGMAGKANPLASLEDARKASSIGTYKDDAREQFLKSQGFANLDSTCSHAINVRKLVAGRVEYIVSTDAGIRSILKQAKIDQGLVENVLTFKQVDLYIAFSKGSDPATAKAWKKALEEMQGDGALQAIRDRFRTAQSAN
jgi:polar amino acid transport system substrate-binding protein